MKISEVNEDNIEIVMKINQYDGWAAKVAEQHPNLIIKILKFCRPGERPSVLKVIPLEKILEVVKAEPDSSYFFVTKFPGETVEIIKTLVEKSGVINETALRIHFNFIIPKLPDHITLEVIKAFPERISWILELKPKLTDEVEKIFKLED
ncbi:MAG: hypothetical protein Athens071416_300 [Parcubacteria group bacterium Athens0714_16]|nr:MAG: hypothetical protein Athens071416_300 [Parcubacteria group bacterium Athens0714_16]